MAAPARSATARLPSATLVHTSQANWKFRSSRSRYTAKQSIFREPRGLGVVNEVTFEGRRYLGPRAFRAGRTHRGPIQELCASFGRPSP